MRERPSMQAEYPVESVADYPRPPRATVSKRIQVVAGRRHGGGHDAIASRARDDAPADLLRYARRGAGTVGRASVCEWKGVATYFERACRASGRPGRTSTTASFEPIHNATAFSAGRWTSASSTPGAHPEANPYYGGWVTADIRV